MSETANTRPAIVARRARINAAQTRAVLGRNLAAGDLLPTGLVLEVAHDVEAGEARLEMAGSNIHYVGHDEAVTVLASVDRDLLDAISVGAFVARASLRLVEPAQPTTVEPVPVDPGGADRVPGEPEQTGKQNRGPLGKYAPTVEHYTGECPLHGVTTFARHKAGRTRAGEQRYSHRCLSCHSDYNLSRRT